MIADSQCVGSAKLKLLFLEFPSRVGHCDCLACDLKGRWEMINKVLFKTAMIIYFGEDNGTPLQYSCLENSMAEEPGRLQSMGSHRVGHD